MLPQSRRAASNINPSVFTAKPGIERAACAGCVWEDGRGLGRAWWRRGVSALCCGVFSESALLQALIIEPDAL